MKKYIEPIRPGRLKNPVKIIKYILERKGNCFLINCGVCPLTYITPISGGTETIKKCLLGRQEPGSKEIMNIIIKKAIEFKVLTEEEIFEALL